jgi:hypothetical protein
MTWKAVVLWTCVITLAVALVAFGLHAVGTPQPVVSIMCVGVALTLNRAHSVWLNRQRAKAR